MRDISVILVSYNSINTTRKALDCLYSSSQYPDMKVVMVDNASTDQSADIIRREYPAIHLVENRENVGFGRANNQALAHIDSKYVLLLNTDAFVEPDSIEKTLKFMDENPGCGILGVRLVGRDGTLQPSCRYFPTPWKIFLERSGLKRFFRRSQLVDDLSWDHTTVRDCDWVPGCYLLIRKEVIDQVGLFDPRYFLYYEEVDLCFAAKKAGWAVTFFPHTAVVHLGGESAKSAGEVTKVGSQIEALQIESELLYFRKNFGLLAVFSTILLGTVSDIIQLLKNVFRLRFQRTLFSSFAHTALIWKLLVHTHLGLRNTR